MSGRAGRRGIDKYGFVIILPLYELPNKDEIKSIMLSRVPSIESKFSINYPFILKIIQSNSCDMNEFVNVSLFNQTNKVYLESYDNELIIWNQKLNNNNFNNLINSSTNSDQLKKYFNIVKLEEKYKNTNFRLNNKQRKLKQKLYKKLVKNT